jgi:hypothetical protein
MTSVTRSDSVKLHGRLLTRGTEFSAKGHRGRYRFVEHVQHADGVEWVTGYGGDRDPRGRRSFVSVRPEDIRTVHSKNKMR